MEASDSPKDSSGRQTHSDWPLWNLQQRGSWSSNAPSDPSHQAASEPPNAREKCELGEGGGGERVTESEMPFFFLPGRNSGSAFLALPPASKQSILYPVCRHEREWPQCCEVHGPSLPSDGRTANAAGALGASRPRQASVPSRR